MKKIYLTLGLGVLFLGANAQQAQKKSVLKKSTVNSSLSSKHNGNNAVNTLTCDTVTTITATSTLSVYTVPSSTALPDGGYVAGNNGYGDDQKATFIPGAMVPANGSITGVIAIFFKETPSSGTVTAIGTHGTSTISVTILNGDTTTGPSGAALGTSTLNLSTLATMTASTAEIPYLFTFGTPVAAPAAGFFTSLTLPTVTGDTAALWMTAPVAGVGNYAWDHNPGNSGTGWLDFSVPADWATSTSLALFPIICYQPAGIKTNVLEKSIAYFPNPTNGEFNFAVALPEATNLTISITNMLGQTVFSKVENNISNSVIRYDLSSIGKGVYFANITDSKNNTVTKKVIVQ